MITNSEKNWATLTHLSALSQYFFPLGNFLLPIIIWSSKKDQSEYVDYNGKESLNFQLSVLLYSLILGAILVPIFLVLFFKNIPMNEWSYYHHLRLDEFQIGDNIGWISTGLVSLFLLIVLKIVEFFLIIQASIKTANGERYRYPLTIKFLK